MTKSKVSLLIIALSSFLILLGFLVLALDETAYKVISESYLFPIEEIGIWLFLPLVLVFAPVVEEACFRLWLRPKHFWGIFLSLAFLVLSVQNLFFLILTVLLVVLIAVYFKRLKPLVGNYSAIAMMISGLLFSLVHAGNFSELHFAHFWLFLIYLGLGTMLGLARLRFGLWAAILLHFSYNLLVTVPVLPSWKGSTMQFENAILTEHGMFEDNARNTDFERQLCNECSVEKLIQTLAYRVFPEALVVVEMDGDVSFKKYTLEASDPMDHESILAGLNERFQIRMDTTYEVEDEVRISFLNNPEFEYSPENILKHRTTGLDGRTFPGPKFLIPDLEREYGVKIDCTENCDAELVLPIKYSLSVEQNLTNLAGLGLINYRISKRKMEVITIYLEE